MPGALNVADNLFEGLDGFAGDHKLVLQEALGAVPAVPLADEVERLVELRQVLHLVAVRSGLQPPQLTDGHHGQLVHGEVREDVRDGHQLGCVELQRLFRQLGGVFLQLVQRGQGSAGDGGTAQFRFGRNSVEPCRRVGVVLLRTVGVEFDGFVQRRGHVAVGNEVGRFGTSHRDACAHNDAGEAHAADGCPEEFAIGVIGAALWLEVQDAAVGNQKLHGSDVVTEGTGGVVVLAVNIGADSSTDGDLPGAGKHRNPQPVGECGFHELVEGDATVDVGNSRVRVNGVDFIERSHVDDKTTAVLGRVAVGTAQTTGDHATLEVVGVVLVLLGNLPHCAGNQVQVGRGQDFTRSRLSAPPPCETTVL